MGGNDSKISFSLKIPGIEIESSSQFVVSFIFFVLIVGIIATTYIVLTKSEQAKSLAEVFSGGGLYKATSDRPEIPFKKTYLFWTPRINKNDDQKMIKKLKEIDSRYPDSYDVYLTKKESLEGWLEDEFGGWSRFNIEGSGRRKQHLQGSIYLTSLPKNEADVSVSQLNDKLGELFPAEEGKYKGNYYILIFNHQT